MQLERGESSLEGCYDEIRSAQAMASNTFTAVLHQEDDLWVAICPEVGTASQGPTIDEALANLKEAAEFFLEEFPQTVTSRSVVTTFETADA